MTSTGTIRCYACIRNRRSTLKAWLADIRPSAARLVLPHRAVAKIDMRLVPDMTVMDTLAKLKAHLDAHGFGDIEVNMTGGYDPTQTEESSKFMQAILKTYRKLGVSPQVVPRSPGSGRATDSQVRR